MCFHALAEVAYLSACIRLDVDHGRKYPRRENERFSGAVSYDYLDAVVGADKGRSTLKF